MNADDAIAKLSGVVSPEILAPLVMVVANSKVLTFRGKPLTDCTDAELREIEPLIQLEPLQWEVLAKEWKRRRAA